MVLLITVIYNSSTNFHMTNLVVCAIPTKIVSLKTLSLWQRSVWGPSVVIVNTLCCLMILSSFMIKQSLTQKYVHNFILEPEDTNVRWIWCIQLICPKVFILHSCSMSVVIKWTNPNMWKTAQWHHVNYRHLKMDHVITGVGASLDSSWEVWNGYLWPVIPILNSPSLVPTTGLYVFVSVLWFLAE